jgi:hypothetical protein
MVYFLVAQNKKFRRALTQDFYFNKKIYIHVHASVITHLNAACSLSKDIYLQGDSCHTSFNMYNFMNHVNDIPSHSQGLVIYHTLQKEVFY